MHKWKPDCAEWRPGPNGGAAAYGVERWCPVAEATPAMLFGSMLRRMREQAGLTQAELAARVCYSASLISAAELGAKPAEQDLVERLDKELSANGLLLEVWPITTIGRHSAGFVASLEDEACKIHDWEPRFIPGLLQTADYARAVISAVRPMDSGESIEEDVRLRTQRQSMFSREIPPTGWFIIDESVLYRPFGGRSVMRSQLARLEELASQPAIVIQVMEHSETRHPGAEGPLRIL
jgi:transcriptional regulator with XRE-family HTH domain